MLTTLIAIGNSRGIRIPKPILAESGLSDVVELKVKRGEIRIIASPTKKRAWVDAALSEKALAADWNRLEEDKAWENLM